MVDQLGPGRVDARLAQRFQGMVFGQQQIRPALGDRMDLGQRELHDHMGRSCRHLGKGDELGLLAPGGGARNLTQRRLCSQLGIDRPPLVSRDRKRHRSAQEALVRPVTQQQVAHRVMPLRQQRAQVLAVIPLGQPGGQPQQRSVTGGPGSSEESSRAHVCQPPGQPLVVNRSPLLGTHHPALRGYRHQNAQTQDSSVLADPVHRDIRQPPPAIAQQIASRSGRTNANHLVPEGDHGSGDRLLAHAQHLSDAGRRGGPSPQELTQGFVVTAHVEWISE